MTVEIGRADLGGAPVFFAPAPPPFVFALAFRVGRCDEQAARAGITHVVEHLALPYSSRRSVDYNGSVDNILTMFWAIGDEDLVLPFMAEVPTRLQSLPLERFETERSTLLAEEATKGVNLVGLAFALRFGPNGHGLSGYDEYGLRTLRPDDVVAWARDRFVARNAALWVTAPEPPELELRLPRGHRQLPPAPTPLSDPTYPCFYGEAPGGGVALSFLSPRTMAAAIALNVLEHRVAQRLRYDLGLSYSPSLQFMPLDADVAHSVLLVDAVEANVPKVLDEVLGLVAELAEHGPTDEELEDEVRVARRDQENPLETPNQLFYAGAQHLLGAPHRTPAQLLAEREATTAGQVTEAAAHLTTSLFALAPSGTPRPESLPEYPLTSSRTITGRRHTLRGGRFRRRRGPPHVVAGEDGIMYVPVDGIEITVPFHACVAAVRRPDGSRTLLSDDGFFVTVERGVWEDDGGLVAHIDAGVPAEVVVREEPALLERMEAFEQVAAAAFKRRWTVSDELELLPDRLEDSELPLVMCSASIGWRRGALLATDRRLIFVAKYSRELWREWRWDEITEIERRKELFDINLVVTARDDEPVELSDLAPKRVADELLAVFDERRQNVEGSRVSG